MDDQFLKNARQEPRPEFAHSLRERLRRQDAVPTGRTKAARRLSPAVTAFAALLVIAGLFSIPAVRASAQAFLDLFRARNFAAVTVDAARLEQLRNQQVDVEAILGQPEVVRDPGPLQMFLSAREAASAAGYTVREAVDAPRGLHADTTYVRGESMARLRVDANRLRTLLTSLAIDDVQVPSSIDGAEVTVHVMPVARTVYRREGGGAILIQSPSPELSLPPGIDIAQLGEIGLRIAGLSSSDAKRFARSVDWHSTLLVPVPSNASSFREVDVRGHKGLLVSLGVKDQRQDHARWQRSGSQLMWSDGDRVFAVVSQNLSEIELVQMANAVQ